MSIQQCNIFVAGSVFAGSEVSLLDQTECGPVHQLQGALALLLAVPGQVHPQRRLQPALRPQVHHHRDRALQVITTWQS